MQTIKVFRYIEELDAFLVTPEFAALSGQLGLTEWHPVVWVGRLFTLDRDYGEHWFDNWNEREALEARASEIGIKSFDLMVVNPMWFSNGKDGSCNTSDFRKRFWTDVLRSLELTYDLLFDKARQVNEAQKQDWPEDYIPDLEDRIARITAEVGE